MHCFTAQSISEWDEKVLISKKDAITCDQSRQSFTAIHDFCLLRFEHFHFFASQKMLKEFFHQLDFISFDSMETASIVSAIFLDCKAKLRQNDSANLYFKFAFILHNLFLNCIYFNFICLRKLKRENLSTWSSLWRNFLLNGGSISRLSGWNDGWSSVMRDMVHSKQTKT